jgi:hypothetical protein
MAVQRLSVTMLPTAFPGNITRGDGVKANNRPNQREVEVEEQPEADRRPGLDNRQK